ncbi:unnamed protein product, partial [Ectocarpus sp. 13 AM-2016]
QGDKGRYPPPACPGAPRRTGGGGGETPGGGGGPAAGSLRRWHRPARPGAGAGRDRADRGRQRGSRDERAGACGPAVARLQGQLGGRCPPGHRDALAKRLWLPPRPRGRERAGPRLHAGPLLRGAPPGVHALLERCRGRRYRRRYRGGERR